MKSVRVPLYGTSYFCWLTMRLYLVWQSSLSPLSSSQFSWLIWKITWLFYGVAPTFRFAYYKFFTHFSYITLGLWVKCDQEQEKIWCRLETERTQFLFFFLIPQTSSFLLFVTLQTTWYLFFLKWGYKKGTHAKRKYCLSLLHKGWVLRWKSWA